MKDFSKFLKSKLMRNTIDKWLMNHYKEIPTRYDAIFTGMTSEDIKTKKWIEKFMSYCKKEVK